MAETKKIYLMKLFFYFLGRPVIFWKKCMSLSQTPNNKANLKLKTSHHSALSRKSNHLSALKNSKILLQDKRILIITRYIFRYLTAFVLLCILICLRSFCDAGMWRFLWFLAHDGPHCKWVFCHPFSRKCFGEERQSEQVNKCTLLSGSKPLSYFFSSNP